MPKRFKSNPSLGEWVLNQRKQYRLFQEGMSSSMTEERIERLEDIDFEWDVRRDVWDRRLDELREYRDKHGDFKVPQDYEPSPSLAKWVMKQRQYYRILRKGRPSQMTEERIDRLEGIGFEWDGR